MLNPDPVRVRVHPDEQSMVQSLGRLVGLVFRTSYICLEVIKPDYSLGFKGCTAEVRLYLYPLSNPLSSPIRHTFTVSLFGKKHGIINKLLWPVT
jgi:hypothetical protein